MGVRGLAARSKDEVSVNLVSGCVTNVGNGGGLGIIVFSLTAVSEGLVSTVEIWSMLPLPTRRKIGNLSFSHRDLLP